MTITEKFQVKKGSPPIGIAPAIALHNPQYGRNVGAVVRAASCYGIQQVWYSGDRVAQDLDERKRLPREERMKGYGDVEVRQYDYFFDMFGPDVTPVGVEINPSAEILNQFEHPANPLYVFGPEDGGLDSTTLRHCHRVVAIPTRHCLNLAAAVNVILYDRHAKRIAAGLEPQPTATSFLAEDRGFDEGMIDLFGVEEG